MIRERLLYRKFIQECLTLEDGIDWLETSVANYQQPPPCNISEERRLQLQRGGSLESRKFVPVHTTNTYGAQALIHTLH